MNESSAGALQGTAGKREIFAALQKFQRPELHRSIVQILTSAVPLLLLFWLMHLTYPHSKLLTAALSLPASIFLIRVFIIQHDCGHGSYFRSRMANDVVGWACSLLTFFPYVYWRHQHALHHASTGKLDERGNGDVFLYTVQEYMALSRWEKIKYRLVRNPVTLFLFGPFVLFLVMNRFAYEAEHSPTPMRVRIGLYISNLLLLAQAALAVYFLGWAETALVFIPTIFLAGVIGTFLFYVQHQFEQTYWEEGESWDFVDAALHGSSYFDLPRFLHWCTGNIGYHHIHHLSPKIPNYRLPESQDAHPSFNAVRKETLGSSFRTLILSLWDEKQKRLISFSEFHQRYS